MAKDENSNSTSYDRESPTRNPKLETRNYGMVDVSIGVLLKTPAAPASFLF